MFYCVQRGEETSPYENIACFPVVAVPVLSAGQKGHPIPAVGTCERGKGANLVAVASNGLSDVAGLDGIAVSLNTTGRSALFSFPLLGFS